jgi:hypothetical protein
MNGSRHSSAETNLIGLGMFQLGTYAVERLWTGLMILNGSVFPKANSATVARTKVLRGETEAGLTTHDHALFFPG